MKSQCLSKSSKVFPFESEKTFRDSGVDLEVISLIELSRDNLG